MLKIFILFTFIVAATASQVKITACDEGGQVPDFVESDFCSSSKCTFKRGQDFVARAGFTPKGNFKNLSARLSVKFWLFWIEVDLPKSFTDVCKSLEADAECPVEAGVKYVWAINTPVDSSLYSLGDVEMELKITDGDKNVGCARLMGVVE